jgi:hypothetical protein
MRFYFFYLLLFMNERKKINEFIYEWLFISVLKELLQNNIGKSIFTNYLGFGLVRLALDTNTLIITPSSRSLRRNDKTVSIRKRTEGHTIKNKWIYLWMTFYISFKRTPPKQHWKINISQARRLLRVKKSDISTSLWLNMAIIPHFWWFLETSFDTL